VEQIELAKDSLEPPQGPEREFTVRSRSHREMVLRRFLHHRLAVGSIVVLALVVLLALFGGRLWHYSYTFQSNDLSQGPSLRHPFGTDELGRDTFARVLRGANKSVVIALMVAFMSTGFGALVGALAYQFGGRNNGWIYLAFILAAFYWQPIARVVRGVFLSLREKEYVEAARALGAGNGRIMFRHLLPNAVGPIIVNATLVVALAILAETALSYIGLGIQPPDTSLGQLVAQGQQAATTRPWLFYFPGLFIIVIVLTINFVGDGLRDAFDPTQTRVRA